MKLHRAAKRPFNLLLALVLAAFAAPLYAGLQDGASPVRPEFARVQNGISRDQAAELVKQRYGGKILAISEVQKDGRSMYRIKGLSDKSQVYVVFVDKQTGRIVR